MTKAFVLHSGGVDSTTCLKLAIDQFGAENVTSISVDYGQRHIKESEYAKMACDYFGVRHEVVNMAHPPKSMLTDAEAEVPNASYLELEGVSPTYVPFRNGQLLSRIAGIADAVRGEHDAIIFMGIHAEDAAGWAYPDCTPEFFGAMANAIYIGTYMHVRLQAPLLFMMKQGIVELGEKIGVPWNYTWSCYKGEENHCGTCPTCRARHAGFVAAGLWDPTFYEKDPTHTPTALAESLDIPLPPQQPSDGYQAINSDDEMPF